MPSTPSIRQLRTAGCGLLSWQAVQEFLQAVNYVVNAEPTLFLQYFVYPERKV